MADDRYLAEDAAELVEVDYEPLPAVADYATAGRPIELVHAGWERNVCGQMGGRPIDSAGRGVRRRRRRRRRDDPSAGLRRRRRWRRAASSPSGRRADGQLTMWAATQSPHDLRLFASRLLGLDENRIRVIARDTGGAFGQKINAHREDMCVLLAARKLPAALKYVEDRRENLMASSSRHEHGHVRMAFDADGTTSAPTLDHVQDVGAYPIPYPVFVAMATGMMFPGPYRLPDVGFSVTCMFSNTPGRTAYRGPVAVRDRRPRADARRRGATARHRPCRTAPSQHAASRRAAVHQPVRDDLHRHDPARDVRRRARADRLRRVPREQAAARAEGRYLGIGTSSYVEPTASAMPFYGSEGATIRIEPTGVVNVYLAGGSAGNSLETTAVQLTADALGRRHRPGRTRSRATRRSRRSAPGPAGAAAAR